MDRRTFLAGTGAVLLAAPLAAEAQQPGNVPRIGWLQANQALGSRYQEAFLKGLRDRGYVEGRNVVIEYRDAEGSSSGSPPLRLSWLRSGLTSSLPQVDRKPWRSSKRPRPSPLSSLVLAIRSRSGSSPAWRGRAAISQG